MTDPAHDRKPEPPDVLACCQGNCVPCIFDVYERELERWERAAMTRRDACQAEGPSPLELLKVSAATQPAPGR